MIEAERVCRVKLNRLNITGFRGLSNVNIDLGGKSAVFFGVNGAGKTSVLRGINLLYASIINKVVNRKELRQQYNIELNDIRYGKPFAKIQGDFLVNTGEKSSVIYERGMERRTGKRTHTKENLDIIAASIQESYLNDEKQESIPIFVNYGTNRLVLDIPLRIRTHHEFDVYSAYEKAIENRIDFRTFFEWYRNQEDSENAVKVQNKDFDYEDHSLAAVRLAIMAMLPEFRNIHITRKPRLAMVVEKEGMNLNVSQLSDGEKCALALFGDLAKRLSLANPNLQNPLLGEGVVLIDEIELHMHPSWQRMILGVLRSTFPNVQFIITTHSPIVLSEVDDSYNIFFMENDGKGTTINDFRRLDGYDTNYILESFMGTKSRNKKTEELIRSMYKAINSNDEENAVNKLERLIELTNNNNEDVIAAKLLMKKKGMSE
ncbi:MAG TPA: ATP-binding protein [Lachnospiraceae bacterium]|nr:ATP-binding protein [Lachnospiraceae bacterium]